MAFRLRFLDLIDRRRATLVEMQRECHRKSPVMPGLYARHQAARRGAMARLRYKE